MGEGRGRRPKRSEALPGLSLLARQPPDVFPGSVSHRGVHFTSSLLPASHFPVSLSCQTHVVVSTIAEKFVARLHFCCKYAMLSHGQSGASSAPRTLTTEQREPRRLCHSSAAVPLSASICVHLRLVGALHRLSPRFRRLSPAFRRLSPILRRSDFAPQPRLRVPQPKIGSLVRRIMRKRLISAVFGNPCRPFVT